MLVMDSPVMTDKARRNAEYYDFDVTISREQKIRYTWTTTVETTVSEQCWSTDTKVSVNTAYHHRYPLPVALYGGRNKQLPDHARKVV
jgi:plasmid replication initiation protein